MVSKWSVFSLKNQSLSKTTQSFGKGLSDHLKKPFDEKGEKNQPSVIINNAINTHNSGLLSRIFDSFSYPADYKEVAQLSAQKNGLRKHIKEFVEEITPYLLDENHSKLNIKIIDVINSLNFPEDTSRNEKMTNYEYLRLQIKSTDEGIALQFMKAAVVSYSQRLIDSINIDATLDLEQSTSLQLNFFNIGTNIQEFANEIDLKEGLKNQATQYSWQPKKRGENALSKLIDKHEKLITQAHDLGIITDKKSLYDQINTARAFLHMDDMSIETKQSKISPICKTISLALVNNTIKKDIPNSSSSFNWLKALIRMITGNKNLYETPKEIEEKLYSKLNKLEIQLKQSGNQIFSVEERKLNRIIEKYDKLLSDALSLNIINTNNALHDEIKAKISAAKTVLGNTNESFENKQNHIAKLYHEVSTYLVDNVNITNMIPASKDWVKTLVDTTKENKTLFEILKEKSPGLYSKIHKLEAQLQKNETLLVSSNEKEIQEPGYSA